MVDCQIHNVSSKKYSLMTYINHFKDMTYTDQLGFEPIQVHNVKEKIIMWIIPSFVKESYTYNNQIQNETPIISFHDDK